MGIEIERRFLVKGEEWRGCAGSGVVMEQGYLACAPEPATVRVRLTDGSAVLTIKGPSRGFARAEFEVPLPQEDARELIDGLCGGRTVSKIRYRINSGGLCWEIDEFLGRHHGLVIAEVELESEDQAVELPEWAGEEVSLDPRYSNAALAAGGLIQHGVGSAYGIRFTSD